MRSIRPHVESVNPREVLARGGASALAEMLARTGYMVQERVLMDMTHAIKSGKPHIIEGERGSGKTALAEALAEACNLPVFYLQGMEGLELEDVLYSWDREGQARLVKQALDSGLTLEEARDRQWSRDYLVLGEALGAFAFAAETGVVPILIIDEIDKLKDRIEDMLLQLFGRGVAHVPRYGDVGVRDRRAWPVVVLLSNDIRHDLSAPLRSRCIYTWMDMPTAREEVSILCRRVPGAAPEMVARVAKLLECVRDIPGVADKPALREGIDLLQAFTRDGVREVDERVLIEHLCYVAKRHSDRDYLIQSVARIEMFVNDPHEEVDAWVSEEFGRWRPAVLEAVAGEG